VRRAGEKVIKIIAVQRGKVCLVLLLVLCLAAVFAGTSRSQDQARPNVEIKKVPVRPTTMVQGEQLYRSHCATCHGTSGKGNGPAASALKTPPPDLTLLAKNNDGKFPDLKVVHVLESGTDLTAHGSKDMPIWGPIFRSMGPAAAGGQVGHLREVNLTEYLKSIQEK
jgi:mono/diheme cytochrome c family protein